MKELLELVGGLQPGEVKTLWHLLELQNQKDCKKAILLDQCIKLKSCKEIPFIEKKIYYVIYGNRLVSGNVFEKLKRRLGDDIINVMLLQDSPED